MFKNQVWTMKQCIKAKPFLVFFMVLIYIFLYLMQPFEVLITQKIVSTVSEINNIKNTVLYLVLIYFIVLSFMNMQYTFSLPFIEIIENKIITLLHAKLFNAVSKTNLTNLDKNDYLTKLQRARSTCWYTLTNIFNENLHFIGETISTFFTTFLLLKINVIYPLIYILIGLIYNATQKEMSKQNYELNYEIDLEQRRQDYFINLFIDKNSMKEIRSYNVAKWLIEKWNKSYCIIKNKSLKYSIKWIKYNSIIELTGYILDKLVLIYLVYNVRSNVMNISDFIIIFQSKGIIINGVSSFISRISSIYKESKYIQELIDIIDEPVNEVKRKCNYINEQVLTFNNVSFKYDDNLSINNISFTLDDNEIMAIVGENGSGKSTFAKLALNLLEPYSGEVFNRHGHKSASFQDFACFEFSIRDNVGFGDIKLINEDREIITAMKNGMSYNILSRVEKGLDSILGKNFEEDGIELSGGEWQRMAISRSLMGSPILLIFDEPSAALDPLAELEQYNNIKKNLKNRSAIIISHRIGITKLANRILYMEDGKIVENGNHDELMNMNGKYKSFYETQSKWYKDGF